MREHKSLKDNRYGSEKMKYDIVLASASPRRIEMFKNNGYEVKVMPADIEENLPKDIKATDAVMFLALKKALHIEEKLLEKGIDNDTLIVAADTVVAFEDRILGKPENEKDAFDMLSKLNGNVHYVATGVALLVAGKQNGRVFYDKTYVEVLKYTDEDIYEYIASGEPMDKAGAYAIQGGFGKYVKEYRGSYSNIVGFPWGKFQEELKKL